MTRVPLGPERPAWPRAQQLTALAGGRVGVNGVESAKSGSVRRVAILGNHLPRQCGIATFTSDLAAALSAEHPNLDCFVVAMNDAGRRHEYPATVRFELAETDAAAYRRAADFLNESEVDVLSLQHEFGIFGGSAGAHVLTLVSALRVPVVTTFHTVLSEPTEDQRRVMDELTRISQRVVVMTRRAAGLLARVHRVPEAKIDVVPHGIPPVRRAADSKSRVGLEGRTVLLTFGLLSPDKGIEHVIDALPAITARVADLIYVVVGATHPHVKERHGEAYRRFLERRADDLGVSGAVVFHDRFVGQHELTEFLAAADIYVTPYVNLEQASSGTLAYAVGAGCAAIATPFRYAEELLSDGIGVLVPPADPLALAREVIGLATNDLRRAQMGRRAALAGDAMRWPAVARSYGQVFAKARLEHFECGTAAARSGWSGLPPTGLPRLDLAHLELLTDDTGILQHAAFAIPRYDTGYCLDDNARALVLTTHLTHARPEELRCLRSLAARYLAFTAHAFDPERRRFRNFMSFSREWLEEEGSDDSHGRAVWALGAVVGRAGDASGSKLARQLFEAALSRVPEFTSPRAWAFALIGIDDYLRVLGGNESVEAKRDQLAKRLFDLYLGTRGPEWLWFEDNVTYDNARLPQALLLAGRSMGSWAMVSAGLEALEWLESKQRGSDGTFAPVGSMGFFPRGGEKARFDCQPLEACAMVSACVNAWRLTGNRHWLSTAHQAFAWFLGENHLKVSLYDATTGGCRDGLHADRPNENQGAESTLSFLMALSDLRAVEQSTARLVGPLGAPS